MVVHICNRCGKKFNQKCHLNAHSNRKKSCIDNIDNKYNDNCIDSSLLNNLPNDNSLIDNSPMNNQFVNYSEDSLINNKLIMCEGCNKNFATIGSLKRHLNNRCKLSKKTLENNFDYVKIVNELKEQNKELKKMVMELIKNNTKIDKCTNINNQINNKLNGNITNNSNNNIKIEFGKEDLSKLSNDFFIKTLINSSGAAIPCKIIEGIHFNPDLKENMNVYISDVSRNKAMIHDGKKWNIANADEIINTLFDKAIIFCEDRNEELFEKIQKNEKIKKKINKEMYVMNIMSNNEPYEYNEYKEPIDVDGNILDSNELKRGACLSGVAKEHIKHSLYNKKGIVVNK
jgi:hypothetical protein